MVKEQEKEAEIQLIKEMMEREVTTASVEEEITKKARYWSDVAQLSTSEVLFMGICFTFFSFM